MTAFGHISRSAATNHRLYRRIPHPEKGAFAINVSAFTAHPNAVLLQHAERLFDRFP